MIKYKVICYSMKGIQLIPLFSYVTFRLPALLARSHYEHQLFPISRGDCANKAMHRTAFALFFKIAAT